MAFVDRNMNGANYNNKLKKLKTTGLLEAAKTWTVKESYGFKTPRSITVY